MSVRKFLFKGETVFVEGISDCVKISSFVSRGENSSELISSEYLPRDKPYRIGSVDLVRFEYLEFSRSRKCPEKYCLTNSTEAGESRTVKTEIFSVLPPVKISERIIGNYLLIKIESNFITEEIERNSIVSVNNRRMRLDKKTYKIKIQEIENWTDRIYLTVEYEQINYTEELFLKLPKDFFYSVSYKRIDRKYYVKIVLARITAETYEIEIRNRTGQRKKTRRRRQIKQTSQIDSKIEQIEQIDSLQDTLTNLGHSSLDSQSKPARSFSLDDLKVLSSSSLIVIDSPNEVTEVLLEIEKKKKRRVFLFSARVNSHLIEFLGRIN